MIVFGIIKDQKPIKNYFGCMLSKQTNENVFLNHIKNWHWRPLDLKLACNLSSDAKTFAKIIKRIQERKSSNLESFCLLMGSNYSVCEGLSERAHHFLSTSNYRDLLFYMCIFQISIKMTRIGVFVKLSRSYLNNSTKIPALDNCL